MTTGRVLGKGVLTPHKLLATRLLLLYTLYQSRTGCIGVAQVSGLLNLDPLLLEALRNEYSREGLLKISRNTICITSRGRELINRLLEILTGGEDHPRA